jgi:hypothetical protein
MRLTSDANSYYDTNCKNYAGTSYTVDNVVGGPYGSKSMMFRTGLNFPAALGRDFGCKLLLAALEPMIQ